MKTERTTVTGVVKFYFRYTLLDAEIRPCQYTNGDYKPEALAFNLSAQTTDGTAPSYDDLKVSSAHLRGHKLKKDRTTGLAETNETFSVRSQVPEWVTRLIEAATTELREGL